MTLFEAVEKFERELPGWWWTVGDCSVSADASCGPDRVGPDVHLLDFRLFDEGFDVDLRHRERPSNTPRATPSDALLAVLEEAKAAKAAFLRGELRDEVTRRSSANCGDAHDLRLSVQQHAHVRP